MAHLQNLNEAGVALQGYDPVSYYSNQPVKGNAEIKSTYVGGIYHFSSGDNKAKFDAAPQQYVPQYGGFCSTAMSEGRTFPIDPNTYIVADDKLYLFYNGKRGNTKTQWEKDAQTRQASADNYWQNNELQVIYPTMNY